jgi:hypothetical protein
VCPALRPHGISEQILTDNGKVFTGRFGPGPVLFDRICRDRGQRVYEYAVEPTVLQHLPYHVLLLTRPGRTGRDLRGGSPWQGHRPRRNR